MKTVVLSVIFIFIIHQIINFLTDTLTVPKTKDLVSIIEKKYDEIHKTLQEAPRSKPSIVNYNTSQQTTSLSDLPICPMNDITNGLEPHTVSSIAGLDPTSINTPDIDDMMSELKLFITQQG